MTTQSRQIPLLAEEEYRRRRRRADSPWPELWSVLDSVKDPEIPVVSIWELGILQDVTFENGIVTVTITPTYSGCPAMGVIAQEIGAALSQAGYPKHRTVTRLSPAWTTAWMSNAARAKLRDYGIAPPCVRTANGPVCPQCGSPSVRLISEFGSTACKSLYRCDGCGEPIDYFKNL